MKNYRDSDYAVNKYASGIVYRFADTTVEVTLEDYLRENPDKTEADFAKLKALSDEMYLEQVRSDTAQGNKTMQLHALEEIEGLCTPTVEESVIYMPEQTAIREQRLLLAKQAYGQAHRHTAAAVYPIRRQGAVYMGNRRDRRRKSEVCLRIHTGCGEENQKSFDERLKIPPQNGLPSALGERVGNLLGMKVPTTE